MFFRKINIFPLLIQLEIHSRILYNLKILDFQQKRKQFRQRKIEKL
jgi:hypothetical protein